MFLSLKKKSLLKKQKVFSSKKRGLRLVCIVKVFFVLITCFEFCVFYVCPFIYIFTVNEMRFSVQEQPFLEQQRAIATLSVFALLFLLCRIHLK